MKIDRNQIVTIIIIQETTIRMKCQLKIEINKVPKEAKIDIIQKIIMMNLVNVNSKIEKMTTLNKMTNQLIKKHN